MIKKKISIKGLCNSVGMRHEVLGSIDRYVAIPSPIDEANEDSVSFCSKKAEDALESIRNSRAGVVICSNKLRFNQEDCRDKTLILVANPRLAFIRVMREHFEEEVSFGIHPTAIIDEEAEIAPRVHIGPHCYIGRCQIGEGTIIDGNVYIYPNVKIGRDVVIQAGAVIGARGFSFERNKSGELEAFPHTGGVVIEDDVLISSGVTIARGTMADTIVGEGTKIDPLTEISHNVVIGKHCGICASVVIAGSVKIGDYSWIAPCACLRDGIEIGKNVVVGMGSVVTKDVDDNLVVFGVPAKKHRTR